MQKQKIIIDTDPGDDVDDVLALAFALLRPELDVRAITTVTAFSDRRVHIVRKLLRLLGREDIPVAAGLQMPLRGVTPDERQKMTDNRGYVMNHYGFVSPDEAAAEPPVDGDASGLIARIAAAHPREISFVGIGPSSNLAVALCRYPELTENLRSIALMGGETHLNRAEHNISWDPVAADIVLSAGVPLFLGTWDVTRRCALTTEDCDRLRHHGTPLTDAMTRCIDLWWPHKGHKPAPVMYDLAPILWSLDPTCFETRPLRVHIETRSDVTRGMTLSRGTENPNADVTIDMQGDAARDLLLTTLLAA